MHVSATLKASGLLSLLLAFSSPLLAQAPPDTTGSPAKKAPAAKAAAPAVKPAAPAPAAPVAVGERKVLIKRFEFSGNTLFKTEELAVVVSSYTNREIALKDIYEAADKVADFYHSKGYNLAYVAPPAQKLTEGTVKLEVIEGRVGGVEVAGNQSYETDRLQRYLGDFKAGQVYRLEDLDSGLRRINSLPGISAKATLKPGHDYGTSDLVINADEDRYSATLIGDNYGRDNIGIYRSTLSGAFNNPLHYGDQLQLLYLHSEQGLLDYGYLGYSAPIGYVGTRASVSYAQAKFSAKILNTTTPTPPVEGSNKATRVGLEMPLSSSREGTTSLSAALTNQRSNADLAGAKLSNDINLTLLELSLVDSLTFDNFAVYQASLTAATNGKSTDRLHCDGVDTPATGSTPANPEDCNRQLLRLEGDLQYVQPLIGRLDTLIHLNEVYSPDPLPPVNPFSIGGANSVRGFPTSEERGDNGVLGSLALRYGLVVGPVQTQLRAFGDTGVVSRVQPAVGTNKRDTLSSVGIGTDIFWRTSNFKVNGKVDWSFPTDSHISSDGKNDSRLFASVSVGF